MAIVKGPLLSMDARGQLGKALVFLGWKGIKTVRAHVVPANPNTGPQQIQRGYMRNAVLAWTGAAMNQLDAAAYNLRASLAAAVMSGFNYFCKTHIGIIRDGLVAYAGSAFAITTNTGGNLVGTITLPGATYGGVARGDTATMFYDPIALVRVGVTDVFTYTFADMPGEGDVYLKFVGNDVDYSIVSGIYKVVLGAV